MERRKFLESACKACMFAGAGIVFTDLISCTPPTQVMKLPISGNSVKIPVSAFTTESFQIVRPEGWLYNIAIRKTAADQYEALLMQCTHQNNQLLVSQNGFRCTLHGSQFNPDGQVMKGPAERPLKKFKTSQEQGELVVELKS